MNQEKINFPEVRDFSALFNVSVKFVSQNFKHFFQAMLFIAGPFLLLDSICLGFYQVYILDVVVNNQGRGFGVNYLQLFTQAGWQIFIVILVSIMGRIVLLTSAYAYIIAYNIHGPTNFGVAEVKKIVLQNIGKTIKGFFVFFLMALLFVLVFAGIGGLMMQALPLFTSMILVVVIFGVILVSPPFVWQFSTFYLVQMKDDLGVLESMRKVREIMRGEFFSTWIVIVLAALILGVLTLVFKVPQFIYQVVLQLGNAGITENTIPFIIVSTICGFLVKFIYSLFYIINSFLYYSLDEKKHGTALISRIDEIGNTPLHDVDQYY